MRMKVDAPIGDNPIIQIPSNYSSTDFNTQANYCSGLLLWSFDNRNDKKPSFIIKAQASILRR
ncbi:MAG: hypothetical protein IPN87_17865 [Saprospiraceae bacterium]|nr:hypothetical protein [Candidatus Brachybacter algidus]